ncbi:MAG: DUF4340 domain-containing protein [Chloroflexi bacterium]|nr:DUF4340 domain-containing protein [Chloroflexota bacterium]MDA1270870.1 DUF4340 domain-containing protein [Chloroflexota bacterium]PKB59581.1 MAG: hypothetical protein BZY83_01055 [SAR202 cluster bacterium Casp-Chloro-G2]
MNIRLSILLVVVLIIFGGTFLVLRFTDSNERAETSPWLYRINEGDIVGLEIVYQGEEISYYRSPASRIWYIKGSSGDPDIPVFQERWGGTPLLLSGPKVTRPLSDGIEDPASFGLEPPETAVKVLDRYGNEVAFHLGIPTPDNQNQYARLVGDDTLFTVPIEWASVVNRLANDPPVGRLYQIDPRSALVVQFFRGDDITRYAMEDGTGRWFLEGEEGEEPKLLDQIAWAESLQMMSNPRLDQILASDIDDPKLYGLDPPNTAVVIVRQGGERAIEWYIGDLTPDGRSRYVSVNLGSLLSEDTNLYAVLNSRLDPIIALATDPVLATP